MYRIAVLVPFLTLLAGCSSSSKEIHTYNLGDRVQAGPLLYSVFDTHWYLTLGPAAAPRVPANRFLVIRLNITNGGATDTMVPTLAVIDDSGQSFDELADGSSVPEWVGVSRKIKPMDTLKGTIVFDVPPRHYKLRVADETEQIVADVELPLNLLSDEKAP